MRSFVTIVKAIISLCALPSLVDASAFRTPQYSQNAVCRQNNCINPVFPGINDLSRLEQLTWQCSNDMLNLRSSLPFCEKVVQYNAAVPSPNATGKPLTSLLASQDQAASTMFFYHMTGLGYEPWEYEEPSTSADPCVRATWAMACYTYFPKAEAGCSGQAQTPYMRPCGSECSQYLASCKVECCDESAQCVFSNTLKTDDGATFLQAGYVDAKAPSAMCTGTGMSSSASSLKAPFLLLLGLLGAQWAMPSESALQVRNGARSSKDAKGTSQRRSTWVLAATLVLLASTLQGCTVDIPHHELGNWHAQPDYLVSYEFVSPAQKAAVLNSCGEADLPDTQKCSGRGYCKRWLAGKSEQAVSFCSCNRDYADPECRTRRKSQVRVYFLSLFGGFFGLDYLYLGFKWWACAKFCFFVGMGFWWITDPKGFYYVNQGFPISLYGLVKVSAFTAVGFWWLLDIVKTGSGPVYAHDFRVAADFPKPAFVLTTTAIFMMFSFLWAFWTYMQHRTAKRRDILAFLRSEEERFIPHGGDEMATGNQKTFHGYGATIA